MNFTVHMCELFFYVSLAWYVSTVALYDHILDYDVIKQHQAFNLDKGYSFSELKKDRFHYLCNKDNSYLIGTLQGVGMSENPFSASSN